MLIITKEAGIKDKLMVGLMGAGTMLPVGDLEGAQKRHHKPSITRPSTHVKHHKPKNWSMNYPTTPTTPTTPTIQPATTRPATQPATTQSVEEKIPKNAPRGIRNNNPGNIDRNKTIWEGMSKNQTDSRFITFDSPEHGIRAMAKTITTYIAKYNLNTIEKIIKRWAPPIENNTNRYIADVELWSGINKKTNINPQDKEIMFKIIKAMIRKENGYIPYPDETIRSGVNMAISQNPPVN